MSRTRDLPAPSRPPASRSRPPKTVVWFQGGGPLGAFGCGAWQEIVGALRSREERLVAIGGASIGAMNAAIALAHFDPSGRSDHLERVWRTEIATPSWPFVAWPWMAGRADDPLWRWNGLFTSMVVGNKLYRPQPFAWSPWGMADRLERPLFDRSAMRRLLEEQVPSYRSDVRGTMLAVTTTDVIDGRLRMHHSDAAAIGPDHIAASSAVPGMFEPVPIDGRPQWDGDLLPSSPLPMVIEAVRATGRAARDERLRVITVEALPSGTAGPLRSSPEVMYRAANLAQADKLAAPLRGQVELVRIVRQPTAHDGVSGMFDHSTERIDELLRSGRLAASAALAGTGNRPNHGNTDCHGCA